MILGVRPDPAGWNPAVLEQKHQQMLSAEDVETDARWVGEMSEDAQVSGSTLSESAVIRRCMSLLHTGT